MSIQILRNVNLYTMDDKRPRASAIAILDNIIVETGNGDQLKEMYPEAATTDLAGLTVLPGLIDAHMHMDSYTSYLQAVDARTASLEECLDRVAAKVRERPAGSWITGFGWNQTVWERDFPTAADLDRVAPNHPVLLSAQSGHAAWANSLALQVAGITSQTADPAGGGLKRDEKGQPTGIFFEEAIWLVRQHIPTHTAEQLADMMPTAMQNIWRFGLTGVHDFDGPRSLAAWQILRERGQLGLRAVKTIPVAELDHAIALGLRSGFGDDWVRIGNIKVFLDGALGPRTATMIEPYESEPNNYGMVVTDAEEFYEQAAKAAKQGLAMTVHAIGDRANHDLLNVYDKVRQEETGRGAGRGKGWLRHRCEHVQILHPSDLNRLAQLNVIASMQPIHATSDMLMADRYWGKRNAGAYALRTQIDAGATCAFGSDAPVESLNPFWGIHAAVTRRRADGSPGPEGWYPEQRISVAEAVKGYTLGAAYAGYMESRVGSLTPGKLADLIVIDRDLFQCDPMAIKDTQVLGTMVDGVWRYDQF